MQDDCKIEDDEEEESSWLEHWIVVGHVSDKAKEAIALVGGNISPMQSPSMRIRAMAVCFLYAEPEDNDVGFSFSDDNKALQIDVFSLGEHVTLYLYSIYPNADRDVADITGLHLVIEDEYFGIIDKKNS
jgi:hypothetical protein